MKFGAFAICAAIILGCATPALAEQPSICAANSAWKGDVIGIVNQREETVGTDFVLDLDVANWHGNAHFPDLPISVMTKIEWCTVNSIKFITEADIFGNVATCIIDRDGSGNCIETRSLPRKLTGKFVPR